MKKNSDDIFDKIMQTSYLKKFYKIYKKNKTIILYVFFGGLTTFVSVCSFLLVNNFFKLDVLFSNFISWIIAVAFAYFTNRRWVFESINRGINFLKEIVSFYFGRLSSLIVEEIILYIFVTCFNINSLLVKIISQFVVLILNYLISKFFIFKRSNIHDE